jgi:hypothetical protein
MQLDEFSVTLVFSADETEDTENEEIAVAADSLAGVICNTGTGGDILETEMLSRECLCIMERIYGAGPEHRAHYLHTLSRVLRQKGNQDTEAKDLMEQSLAIFKSNSKRFGESYNIALTTFDLAMFYFDMSIKEHWDNLKTEQLCKAKSYYREAIQNCNNAFGPNNPATLFFASKFERHLTLKMPFIINS